MIAFRLVAGVSSHFMMRLPEWANAITLLLYGQTLLGPDMTFNRPEFSVMSHYASEDTWGWSLVFIGFVRLVALIINGSFQTLSKWSIRARALTATLSCFAWFCIAVGLALANPRLPGVKTYGMHLIVDIILAIHLGHQAGKVDRGIWNGRG